MNAPGANFPTTAKAFTGIRTRGALAQALGISERRLNFLLYKLGPADRYRRFEIKKRSGGLREIRAPVPVLKKAQAGAARILMAGYQPRGCVFGYVKGRNIAENAREHANKTWVLCVDLQAFFPSINFGRIYGLFRAAPFLLPENVAAALAKLCIDGNELPQGSPASPVLSNLLCRGLDKRLAKLAHDYGCKYTRYCDDLVFSTDRKFPAALAGRETLVGVTTVSVGPALAAVIEESGFKVNAAKVRLRHQTQRQMVTGLVVNQKANVPRKFVRELRTLLYVWEKHGLDAASKWYFDNHDKRNRAPWKRWPPMFKRVVRGKVEYLAAIRGWGDTMFLDYAERLAALDPGYEAPSRPIVEAIPAPVRPPAPISTLRLFVEGITDKDHIETALGVLQAGGRFTDLVLDINYRESDHAVTTTCRHLHLVRQLEPVIAIYDGDVPAIVETYGSSKPWYVWGNNVYAIVLPAPAHRPKDDPFCVELLFKDTDFERKDENGRRLFRNSEFMDHRSGGHHKTIRGLHLVHGAKDRPLIVEEDVFNVLDEVPGRQLALKKKAFAELIKANRAAVDFSAFVPFFELLVELRDAVTKSSS